MTGSQEGVSDRYTTTQPENDFVASIDRFGADLVKIGVSVLTLPAALLPDDMRDDVRTTTSDLLSTIARLHRNIALVTIASIGNLVQVANQAVASADRTIEVEATPVNRP